MSNDSKNVLKWLKKDPDYNLKFKKINGKNTLMIFIKNGTETIALSLNEAYLNKCFSNINEKKAS